MKTAQRRLGAAIKALDDNGLRIGGYLVRFTNADDTDLYGEFFDKDTDFLQERGWPVKGRPVLLEHGLDSFAKVMPIGLIDMVQEDEFGLYVEAKLNDRAEYERMLREMRNKKSIDYSDEEITKRAELAVKAIKAIVETGKVGWSSGALPQSVDIGEDKHINSWAIIEGSLTFTPAEPSGTEIAPIKSALEQLSDFMSIPAEPARDAQHIEHEADNSFTIPTSANTEDVIINWTFDTSTKRLTTDVIPTKSTKQGKKNMELWNQLLELIAKLGASLGYTGEGESEAMANAVVDELKADPETPKEEELKEMPPEEVAKAADELAEKAVRKFNTIVAKKKAQADAVAKAFEKQIKNAEREEKPYDPFGAGGMRNEFTGKSNRAPIVSVGESRKYAHMSAEEMALAAKIMQSHLRAGKPGKSIDGRMLIEEGLASEDFVRTMAGKAAHALKRYNGSDRDDVLSQQDYSALKSIKADELNSSAIEAQGGDWVSIFYDNMLWERAREKTELFNLLTSRGMMVKDIPQGAETAEFKIDTASPTVYTRNQARSTDATGRPEVTARITPIGTDKVQATPAEHVLATSNTDILNEDSIINMVAYLNIDIQRTLAESLEDSLINGDTETAASTNINLIDGTPGTGLSKPLYLAYNGFRKHALVTHSGQSNDVNAALSIDSFFETIAEYDDNAIESRTNELIYIVDKDTHRAARRLPELLTPGVAMEGATIYVGKLPDIDGVPIYRSGFLAKSNTAGKISVTPGNNTFGQIVSVFPYYWGYARKRAITIETDRDIMAGVTVFVAAVRHVLLARSAKASTISYHITV